MATLRLEKPRGFALEAASDFYAGFLPGSGMAPAAVGGLTLAFRLDRSFEAVAVTLSEDGDALDAEYTGTDDACTLSSQLSRMLGLDVDGDAWLSVGRRDVVVGRLQSEFPGFFTAAKASPYDAAMWGVIAPRMSLPAAARLKMAIAERHGDTVPWRGRTLHVFPSPAQVAGIDGFPGLAAEKLQRMKGIARAAAAGKLDANRLRAMGEGEALTELQSLRGVGPWTASHIFFRGAAPNDGLPTAEPRVLHALGGAYGIDSPTVETLERLAESWRPFRMWVCVLLARSLHRTGGWAHPQLARERATAGRALRSRYAKAGVEA